MRKILIVIIAVILCLLLSVFIIKQIFFSKYETSYEITQEQIENRILINKITNSINENYLLKTFSKDDAKEEINEQYKPIEQDEVVNELILAKLKESILASKNISLDHDLSKENTNREYNRLKSDETTEEYYLSVKSVLDKYNISEENYLQLLYDYSYDIYVDSIFKNWFVKESGLYKKPDNSGVVYIEEYPEWEKQIESYLKKELETLETMKKS